VTSRGGTSFALWLIQTLFVVKHPSLTWGEPWVKQVTKAYSSFHSALSLYGMSGML